MMFRVTSEVFRGIFRDACLEVCSECCVCRGCSSQQIYPNSCVHRASIVPLRA